MFRSVFFFSHKSILISYLRYSRVSQNHYSLMYTITLLPFIFEVIKIIINCLLNRSFLLIPNSFLTFFFSSLSKFTGLLINYVANKTWVHLVFYLKDYLTFFLSTLVYVCCKLTSVTILPLINVTWDKFQGSNLTYILNKIRKNG